MALKGVMLGARKRDNYAIIDRGGPKGVWAYEIGEVIETALPSKRSERTPCASRRGTSI